MRLAWLTGRHRSTMLEGPCAVTASLASVAAPARADHNGAMSGPRPARCCTSTLFELPKFDGPATGQHGERAEQHNAPATPATVLVIGVIDDHTRLAYCELHSAENAETVSATLERAAVWMREQGCGPVQAVMTDNAMCYSTSSRFADTLAELGARQILIPPYTPRWNGKIERFFGTLDREWAHGRIWPNSHANATAPCHPSCASTTAGAHTQPPAADHPSAASSKSVSRTPRAHF